MRVELEHFIHHPVARVFAVVSDPKRRPEWQENTSDVELQSDGPVAVGTRWTETQRGVGPVRAEVVGFEPDVLWAEAGTSRMGDGRIAVHFAPVGDASTRVRMEVELTLKGLKRAMAPAIVPLVRSQMPKDLDRLARLLDGEG